MKNIRLYPGLHNRVFLDYPLDILLNRRCTLNDHERGLVDLLFAYDQSAGAIAPVLLKTVHESIMTEKSGNKAVIWSTKVKNWTAVVKKKDWDTAFWNHKDASRFSAKVKTLTRNINGFSGYPESEQEEIMQALRMHLFLRERVIGALHLPAESSDTTSLPCPSSGNIVIEGAAGTGKSTLALQIALAFAHWPNNYHAIYLALEESVDDLRSKAYDLCPCWHKKLKPVRFLDSVEDESSPSAIGKQLYDLLTQPKDCPTIYGKVHHLGHCPKHADEDALEPMVLLPGLSPRGVVPDPDGSHSLFWERLRQLERLLAGAKWLREKENYWQLPQIRLVCVDSLNTFGDRPMARNELDRLFGLFRQYGVIGLCTVESGSAIEEMAASDLVDVLLRLEAERDNGYFLRYLEIVKSRYNHQVYGRHPFKIRCEEDIKREKDFIHGRSISPRTLFPVVKVFPSIHHVVASTEPVKLLDRASEASSDDYPLGFEFGIKGLRSVLSPSLRRNGVIAIVGEGNTFKTALSRHFLLYGISPPARETKDGKKIPHPESVLLVRLHEQASFVPKEEDYRWMVTEDLEHEGKPLVKWENFKEYGLWIDSSKLTRHSYRYTTENIDGPVFFELALKSGAILPEEFLQYVRNIMRDQPVDFPIRRVVLDDVALIGASYPFLRHSQNAGDLFLSAFVHVMRNYGVNLVLIGTRTGLKEADEMVNRASTLSDETLVCEYCDVFGDRYVTVRGGGTAEELSRQEMATSKHSERVPAVIVLKSKNRFSVEPDRLRGLVGFGTGHIHRPGLTLHAFEENDIHRQYKEELKELIGSALGVSTRRGRRAMDVIPMYPRDDRETGSDPRSVEVSTFDPEHNQAFHDGLELNPGKPIDKTIVTTVDEFFMSAGLDERKKRSGIFSDTSRASIEADKKGHFLENIYSRLNESPTLGVLPYYANVLLMAYRADLITESRYWLKKSGKPPRVRSWTRLREVLGDQVRLTYDRSAMETGACLLLELLCPRKGNAWDAFIKSPVEKLTESLDNHELFRLKELTALAELVMQADKDSELERRTDKKKMDPNAAVYVCWYSQLRQVIADDKTGVLSKKLRVCSLPNGGFTGDWYIGVLSGSVSVSLGQDLVHMLCHKKEEYKRLDRGVGLPPTQRFYKPNGKFRIWPGSRDPLSTLRIIHDNARSRAEINDYQMIKAVLYGVWQELKRGVKPKQILKELPPRLKVLRTLEKKSGV